MDGGIDPLLRLQGVDHPIEEVPDEIVEHVWDPEEGPLHPLYEPREPEYMLRTIGGVITPFPTPEAWEKSHAIFVGEEFLRGWRHWGR